MTNKRPNDDQQSETGADLANWRQGDIVVPGRFVWLANATSPSTDQSQASVAAGATEIFAVNAIFQHGLVLITPTCDFHPRRNRVRPFVAVAPLVALDGDLAREAKRGRRPRYAHVPGAPADKLFADLDQVATIETGVLTNSQRLQGLNTPEQRSAFAEAVGRKFNRVGFPDSLSTSIGKWRKRFIRAHASRESKEGQVFRAAVDLRVSADPSWDDGEIEVTIYLIMKAGWLPELTAETALSIAEVDSLSHADTSTTASRLLDPAEDPNTKLALARALQEGWAHLCEPQGVIKSVTFELVGEDEISVAEYRRTDSLDLEFLSSEE